MKDINTRWHPDKEYDEATVAPTYEDRLIVRKSEQKYLSTTVTDKYNEGQEIDTRKEASNKFNRGNILEETVSDKIN